MKKLERFRSELEKKGTREKEARREADITRQELQDQIAHQAQRHDLTGADIPPLPQQQRQGEPSQSESAAERKNRKASTGLPSFLETGESSQSENQASLQRSDSTAVRAELASLPSFLETGESSRHPEQPYQQAETTRPKEPTHGWRANSDFLQRRIEAGRQIREERRDLRNVIETAQRRREREAEPIHAVDPTRTEDMAEPLPEYRENRGATEKDVRQFLEVTGGSFLGGDEPLQSERPEASLRRSNITTTDHTDRIALAAEQPRWIKPKQPAHDEFANRAFHQQKIDRGRQIQEEREGFKSAIEAKWRGEQHEAEQTHVEGEPVHTPESSARKTSPYRRALEEQMSRLQPPESSRFRIPRKPVGEKRPESSDQS